MDHDDGAEVNLITGAARALYDERRQHRQASEMFQTDLTNSVLKVKRKVDNVRAQMPLDQIPSGVWMRHEDAYTAIYEKILDETQREPEESRRMKKRFSDKIIGQVGRHWTFVQQQRIAATAREAAYAAAQVNIADIV
jgi:hypothetical protein